MQKLWRRLKEIPADQTGASVIEVSFLIPLILFLLAGSLIFAIFMLDMAQAKGEAIAMSCMEEIGQQDQNSIQGRFHIARISSQEIKEDLLYKKVHLAISATGPWRGIGDYMLINYHFQTDSSASLDRRKEMMWLGASE